MPDRRRAAGRNSRTAPFFDLDRPEGGLNEFGVPTQFRVRWGNERDGPEGDERLFTPPCCSQWRPAGGDGGRGAAFLNSWEYVLFCPNMESYWDGDNGNSGNNRSCCCDPWRGDSEPLPMLFKVCSAVREQSTRAGKQCRPCIGCQSSNIRSLEHLFQVPQLISQAANLVVAVSLIHQCGFCFCTMFFNSEQDSEDIPVLNHHINLLTPATPPAWSRG